MSSRGIFSPLGTPTPLGSMAHSTLTPLETPGEVEGLKQMDYHLREMETYEQQKLEQSVNDAVNALQNENIDDLWPDAPSELSNMLNGIQHTASHPVTSPHSSPLQQQQEQQQQQQQLNYENEMQEDGTQPDEDPLADICILLQAAGDRGVDLNKWLTHYDKTGTGVLRRRDLHRAVTSLGLGVSVGESECDEQTAERALSQHSFDSLVEYLGAAHGSEIVPYARLLTMVPTRMDTRRERTPDGKSFRDGAPWPPTRRGISPERSVVPLLSTTSRSTPRSSNQSNNKNSSSTSSHKSRSPLSSTKKLNLPLDVRATLGQNKARERVRQRVRQEKLLIQQKLADKKQIVARKQQVCDTVSLTNKMKKSTNKRRLKKTERAAKEAKELLAIQNASSLEDLLRERLTSRTTFGELLRCVRTETTPNGVTSARKFISTLHLTKVIFETIGLKLPLLTAENMMENIRQIQNEEQMKSTAATSTTFSQSSSTTKRGGKKKRKSRKSKKKINSTDVNIESKQIDQEFNLLKSKSSSSKKVSTSACETYFRRVRCAHRIEFNAWETEKIGETEKEMKVLHTTVARALKGDAVSLRRLIQEMQSLETSARLVLGEDPKSVEDIMASNMNTMNTANTTGTSTTKSSNGKKPSRKTTRVRRELRKHNVLPKWQVESEAEKITSVWLLSLEGRAAVRHAAWAAVNRGRDSSEASEPDQPALQAASQTLKTQRLEKLLGTTTNDNDKEGKEGNGSNSTDSKNPFYEMLSHKLFGEYLRETLMSADEWKKSNLLGGVISAGKFPRRPFSEWLEKRNEQEKRNRETVEQWRRHKRRQLSSRAASTIKVATVTSVIEELRLLESNGFTEVKEKGGLGKMRVSARQGIRYLEKIKRIKDFGKENVANAFSQNDSSSSSSASLKQQRGSEIDSSNTTVLWISFQQFLQVMETSLFSLKAYSATQQAADQLLNGNKEDGTKLFIEDISLIEDGTSKIPKVFNENHLQEKMYERQEAYDLWKEKKDSELLKALELKEKKINKKFAKKNKLAKKSKKAVLKWKQGIKARKKTKKFQPRTAWQDVVEPGLDDDDDIDDM